MENKKVNLKNYSYTYVMPFITEFVEITKEMIKYFDNSYLFTDEYRDSGRIFLKFSFNYSNVKFSEWEDKLTQNNLYVNSISQGKSILYEFIIPEKYEEDQIHFINSEPSKMSDEAKKIIVKYWVKTLGKENGFVMGVLKKIKGVLDRSEWLRKELEESLNCSIDKDKELINLINHEKETYVYDKKRKLISLEELNKLFNDE